MYDELSWEMPESLLNGLDFEYKTGTYDFDLEEKEQISFTFKSNIQHKQKGSL